jgi:hypothetical protein
MSGLITKQTGSFRATTADGREITISIDTEFTETATQDSGSLQINEIRNLRTAHGEHVSPQGDGKYLVIESGSVLTSDDPNAI